MARYDAEHKQSALDNAAIRELALTYVGRFATSRAKLSRYLRRKLTERGWDGEGAADDAVSALVVRFAELGYVDDGGYARVKASSMERRGLGERRITAALRADGISDDDRADVADQISDGAWEAAHIFARRRRFGPYARDVADPKQQEKHLAAFLRAGHNMDIARRWVEAAPGEVPEE
ncbi:MAG: regulatory protein RecX [Sphingobium sp.]|nr:regulatory protein RecX [Sphingobium sp.]